MSSQRVKVVVLCEDRQTEAFIRRFLVANGHHPRAIRVERLQTPRGAGEQFVRERYPREVKAIRSGHVQSVLLACIDEDTRSTQPRKRVFDQALQADGQAPRAAGEPILNLVPARNIETWLAYLQGHTVDATSQYAKLARARACKAEVKALKAMCDAGALRQPAPPSLEAACVEHRERMP